ncbi:MAG: hypothetical protein ABIR76_12070 [Polaromonas sp.]
MAAKTVANVTAASPPALHEGFADQNGAFLFHEKVDRDMTTALIFLFLVLPIADVMLWSMWRSSEGKQRHVLTFSLALVALPQAAFLAFAVIRIIFNLLA